VVVQHEWGQGTFVGLHHAKLPVTDVAVSRQWYVDALGFLPELEFVENGLLAGAALRHPDAQVRIALRGDQPRAQAMAGFDAICLSVSNDADLDQVIADLDDRGIPHGDRRRGREGWAIELRDPDDIGVRIYSLEQADTPTKGSTPD